MTTPLMVQCPKCLAQNPQGSRFCNACAEPLSSASLIPSAESPAKEFAQTPAAPRLGMAIASLALGIAACIFSLFVVGALFGLVGLLLGLLHVFQKRGPNSMAWWGIGLSIVSVLASIAMGVVYYHLITASMKNLASESDSAFNSLIGSEAPDIAITTLDGKPIRLSQLKGKRVVLDFWATWCGPCVSEMPHFVRLYKESSRNDMIIIGISTENETKVRSFVAKKGINYPIAVAHDLPSPYKDIAAIPTTLFIDRNGILQSVLVGSRDFDELKDNALTTDFRRTPQSEPAEPSKITDRAGLTDTLRAADPWVGTWKLNIAKSKLQPAPGSDISEALVMFREVDPDTLEITATQVHKDGSKAIGWKCTVPKSGGMQDYQQGAPGKGIAVVKTIIDGHLQHLIYLQNGKQFNLATVVLSKDCKTYTLSGKSNDADGKPYEDVEVYEKQ
jgi:peroxiredoxin